MDVDHTLYAEDSVTRLRQLFEAQFGDTYTYFEDMPLTPPTDAEYPCIMIQKLEGSAVIGPTSTDDLAETIQIVVMKNTADAVGSTNVRTTTQRELQMMVEGQDPTTKDYKSDSVLYVLRHYLTLEDWLIDSDCTIRYGLERPSNMETNVAYAEVTLKTQRRNVVANRQ